jgi:hypothetical protein
MGEPRDGDIVTAAMTMALRTAFRPERAPAPPVGALPPVNGEPELWFATGAEIRQVIAGALTAAQAVKQDVVTILKGT